MDIYKIQKENRELISQKLIFNNFEHAARCQFDECAISTEDIKKNKEQPITIDRVLRALNRSSNKVTDNFGCIYGKIILNNISTILCDWNLKNVILEQQGEETQRAIHKYLTTQTI